MRNAIDFSLDGKLGWTLEFAHEAVFICKSCKEKFEHEHPYLKDKFIHIPIFSNLGIRLLNSNEFGKLFLFSDWYTCNICHRNPTDFIQLQWIKIIGNVPENWKEIVKNGKFL